MGIGQWACLRYQSGMTLDKALLHTPRPSRQIVVLCDGTNANLTGGRADTSVVTLAELLAAHPHSQRELSLIHI